MHTRTKIICTIGPACSSYDKIVELIDAGMNVARINFSHGTQEEHREVIGHLKKARKQKNIPLAIMLDTKGPEIRIGMLENDAVSLEAKQTLLLVKDAGFGNGKKITITPSIVVDNLQEGMTVLFDDGNFIAKVVKKTPEGALIEFQNGGILKSQKGINIPHAHIELPAMTEQDVSDIAFGCQEDVDMIAASFIRSADHVHEIRQLLQKQNKAGILIISKIENSLGVQNFEAILQASDGIMVARGDLGVELPLKVVPRLQKMMIQRCIEVSKPVITATQMLESMIKNPRPTRAEVSDVANAIYDSTSCVMLSGETAIGKYPIEAVQMMKSIVEETEKDFPYKRFFEHCVRLAPSDVSSSVALAAVQTAYSAGAKAIFAFTSGGFTARLISSLRPEIPIVALTESEKVYHQMALNWGVIPAAPKPCKNVQEAFEATCAFAKEVGVAVPGSLAVVTAGSPFGVSGTTNMMMVRSV